MFLLLTRPLPSHLPCTSCGGDGHHPVEEDGRLVFDPCYRCGTTGRMTREAIAAEEREAEARRLDAEVEHTHQMIAEIEAREREVALLATMTEEQRDAYFCEKDEMEAEARTGQTLRRMGSFL